MINDGHFHLHYGYPVPDEKVLGQLQRVKKIREQNGLDKIAGIVTFENVGIIKEIRENHSYIYPGIYVMLERYKNKEVLPKEFSVPSYRYETEEKQLRDFKDNFNFVKINHWLGSSFSWSEMLKQVLDDSISLGIKKFQIHTESLYNEGLDMMKEYVREHDAIFYLAHGINSVYGYSSKVSMDKLKELEGNLLLGTSSHTPTIRIPNDNVRKALDDGLENLVAFESDFILHYDDGWYPATIQSVVESVGNSDKILYENLKTFLL